MTNKEIAEFTTRILESAVTSQHLVWKSSDICTAFEDLFNTIKKMDQENNDRFQTF